MKDKDIRSVIILCGGMSKRMGEDKGSMEIDKKPMIIHQLESLNSQIDEVIIVLNDSKRINNYKLLIQKYFKTNATEDSFDFSIIYTEDVIKNQGPLSGIMTGLKTISGDYGLVLPCDSPYVNLNFVNNMFNIFNEVTTKNNNIDAIVPYHIAGNPNEDNIDFRINNCEPLHSIYNKNLNKTIYNLLESDVKHVKSFIKTIDSYFIPIDDEILKKINFKNINYKKDI